VETKGARRASRRSSGSPDGSSPRERNAAGAAATATADAARRPEGGILGSERGASSSNASWMEGDCNFPDGVLLFDDLRVDENKPRAALCVCACARETPMDENLI